jgi:hypothetical protein
MMGHVGRSVFLGLHLGDPKCGLPPPLSPAPPRGSSGFQSSPGLPPLEPKAHSAHRPGLPRAGSRVGGWGRLCFLLQIWGSPGRTPHLLELWCKTWDQRQPRIVGAQDALLEAVGSCLPTTSGESQEQAAGCWCPAVLCPLSTQLLNTW